jgi:general secretion pathway protein G
MPISRAAEPGSVPALGPCLGGWTLVKLAVALLVVAVLAAIAVPAYNGWRERARVTQAISDITGIESSIGLYEYEYGSPPARLDSAVNPIPLDPWGNPYQYLLIQGAPPKAKGQVRKDKNLVPINTDYDLYSMGPDGLSVPPLTAAASQDDIVRANDGGFVGRASDY